MSSKPVRPYLKLTPRDKDNMMSSNGGITNKTNGYSFNGGLMNKMKWFCHERLVFYKKNKKILRLPYF